MSEFNSSKIEISGGTLSSWVPDGNGFVLSVIPDTSHSRISIEVKEGAARIGVSDSLPIITSFTQHLPLVAQSDLRLWYSFNSESNESKIMDLSGNENHGSLFGGTLVPGKFESSLKVDEHDYLIAEGEWLSLTEDFSLSVWAKVLDDAQGTLISNGQFSLHYSPDATLRGLVSTNGGVLETKTRLLSGQWCHFSLITTETSLSCS